MDELQTIDKIEKDFNRVADMAYEEYCSKMILLDALEDIIEDGTCSASIKEIAQYVEEWLWYELEEEGHTFYTQDNMIYKALQAYKGGANERT